MIQKVRAEKERLAPDCSKCQSPCGKTDEYDMQQLWNADEDTRSLKSLILFGIRGMAAYAYHAAVLGHEDDEVNLFFCEALFKIGYEENTETLLSTVLKRDQHLYSWGNAPSPCLSILKEISSSKRKFRNRMAESTERV